MFLLDTNLVSELRKGESGRAEARVMQWLLRRPQHFYFISVITLLELEKGSLLIQRRDPLQARPLREWVSERIPSIFRDRNLPVTPAIALRCATLHVPDPRSSMDSLIAATALVHGLTVVTRNVRDFEGTGAALYDPWMSVRFGLPKRITPLPVHSAVAIIP